MLVNTVNTLDNPYKEDYAVSDENKTEERRKGSNLSSDRAREIVDASLVLMTTSWGRIFLNKEPRKIIRKTDDFDKFRNLLINSCDLCIEEDGKRANDSGRKEIRENDYKNLKDVPQRLEIFQKLQIKAVQGRINKIMEWLIN